MQRAWSQTFPTVTSDGGSTVGMSRGSPGVSHLFSSKSCLEGGEQNRHKELESPSKALDAGRWREWGQDGQEGQEGQEGTSG